MNKGKTESKKEPTLPEQVLLGLILVNFFPPNNLPNKKPPISENILIESKNRKNIGPKLRNKTNENAPKIIKI